MVKIQYLITDVSKTSLIGPRFMVEVFYSGYKDVCFFQSSERVTAYLKGYFGAKGPEVKLEQLAA